VNLCALQLDLAWEDKAANHRRIEALLAQSPPAPGSLLVLPEMFSTGFSLDLAATLQTPAREDEAFLAHLACQYQVTAIGSVVSPFGETSARNEAVAFSPDGSLLARYAKIHPFSGAGETRVHQPGSELVTFAWQGFTVAPLICYDLRFPELFREATRAGADLFVVMALWPVKRLHHWVTLLQARAIENQAWVVGVNRIGSEPEYHYAGRTLVVDPQGHILADAADREQALTAELDLAAVQAWRRDFPALRDAGLQKDRS
jgi:predicted amidohydrolase